MVHSFQRTFSSSLPDKVIQQKVKKEEEQMTKMSWNSWVLGPVTFLTTVPPISQSCGQASGKMSRNLWASPTTGSSAPSPAQIKFGFFEGHDTSGWDQTFRSFHHHCCPCLRIYHCQVQQAGTPQPGYPALCPASLQFSSTVTPSDPASCCLLISIHAASLLLRLPPLPLHPGPVFLLLETPQALSSAS